MQNKNSLTQFIKSKGVYAALAVCIVGAAAAAWATAARTLDSIEQNNRQIVEQNVSGEEKPSWSSSSGAGEAEEARKDTRDIEKPSSSSSSAPPASSAPEPSSSSAAASAGQGAPQSSPTFSYTPPLEQVSVIAPYSNGQLVKNKTLNVWRTHDAVDLLGAKGDKVMAVGDGKVVSVSNDALWGGVIQIEHPDGFTSTYSGVAVGSGVKEGMEVKAGQELGSLGDIPAEISAEPHLHFTLSKGGKAMDPSLVLELN